MSSKIVPVAVPTPPPMEEIFPKPFPVENLTPQNIQQAKEEIEKEGYTFPDFSSLESAKVLYALDVNTTGCFRQGALPVTLALNDTCNLGFYCMQDAHTIFFCLTQ